MHNWSMYVKEVEYLIISLCWLDIREGDVRVDEEKLWESTRSKAKALRAREGEEQRGDAINQIRKTQRIRWSNENTKREREICVCLEYF